MAAYANPPVTVTALVACTVMQWLAVAVRTTRRPCSVALDLLIGVVLVRICESLAECYLTSDMTPRASTNL